ncbi:hypothetical protein BDV25DRAFT_124064 [Aspergillus avenaceus]|uniref:Uncharacterized protein n=1 Tax=Aspergillus avenaceus TaxID=36643 RepID=A0A5N6TUA7_ASPAV|nr:hypothetical protein BDV25DRAFT_124064 [Aspergillus avenaceus]
MHPFRPRWASQLTLVKPWPRTGLPLTASRRTQLTPASKHISATASTRNSSSAASPERAFRERLQEVQSVCPDPYPRFAPTHHSVSCSEFRSRYSHLENNETVENDSVIVCGRSRLSRLYLVLYLD